MAKFPAEAGRGALDPNRPFSGDSQNDYRSLPSGRFPQRRMANTADHGFEPWAADHRLPSSRTAAGKDQADQRRSPADGAGASLPERSPSPLPSRMDAIFR